MLKRMKDIATNITNNKVYTKLIDAKIAFELRGVGSKETNKSEDMKKEVKGLTDKISDRLLKTHEKTMKGVNEEKEKIDKEVIDWKSNKEVSEVIESACGAINEALNGEVTTVEEPKKEEKSIDEVVDELIKPNGVLDQIEEILEEPKKENKIIPEEGDIDYIISLARMIEDEELENEDVSEILNHNPAKEEEIEEMFNDSQEDEFEIVNMDEAIKLYFHKHEENK